MGSQIGDKVFNPDAWKEIKLEAEKLCPKCKKGKMSRSYYAVGGFPGHEHVHLGSLKGWYCANCGYEELVDLSKKKPAVALLDKIIGGLNRLRTYLNNRG